MTILFYLCFAVIVTVGGATLSGVRLDKFVVDRAFEDHETEQRVRKNEWLRQMALNAAMKEAK